MYKSGVNPLYLTIMKGGIPKNNKLAYDPPRVVHYYTYTLEDSFHKYLRRYEL